LTASGAQVKIRYPNTSVVKNFVKFHVNFFLTFYFQTDATIIAFKCYKFVKIINYFSLPIFKAGVCTETNTVNNKANRYTSIFFMVFSFVVMI
jgi:hypothetical protein